MYKFKLFAILFALIFAAGFSTKANAQNGPVLYFCENYDVDKGEISISDRFYTGYLTVMVKCDYALGLRDVNIQYDRYNTRTGKFEYYKKFDFVVTPDMKYIYFSKTKSNDMEFNDPGFYRVFLLDSKGKTIASGLVEII